jgi:hypothetical protein
MKDDNNKRIEDLERKVASEKESHRTNVFLLVWVIGLLLLAVISGGSQGSMLLGGVIVTALAWLIAKKMT